MREIFRFAKTFASLPLAGVDQVKRRREHVA
jgi:hypothetical protein